MDKTVGRAFINALGVVAYVMLIILFIFYLEPIFPKGDNLIFVPIAMLLLFVFSAAFTGILVFGKPILMYLEGKKKEAIYLVFYTLAFLLILTLAIFILIIAYSNLF